MSARALPSRPRSPTSAAAEQAAKNDARRRRDAAAGSSGSRSSSSCSSGSSRRGRAGHLVPARDARRHDGLVDGVRPSLPGGEWTLENYRSALDAGGFGNAFLNSLAVAIPATVIPITIAAFAAYAFSWMEFRGRYVLFVARRGSARRAAADGADPDPPALHHGARHRRRPHHSRTSTSTARSSASGSRTPRSGFRSRSTCCATTSASLPSSIIESAQIDGADHFTIFWRLVVPLSVPALAAFAIFQFLWVWNDLLVAYVFLGGTPREPGA